MNLTFYDVGFFVSGSNWGGLHYCFSEPPSAALAMAGKRDGADFRRWFLGSSQVLDKKSTPFDGRALMVVKS
jgi:hypothetical protein